MLKNMNFSKREEAQGNEQQLTTLVNDDNKISTGDEYQFWQTIKILKALKIEYHRYQLKTKKSLG